MTPTVDDPVLLEIISRVPLLSGAANLVVSVLPGGLSNASYKAEADGVECVIRITGENGRTLGLDRAREAAVLAAAQSAGISPEVLAFFLPEGHCVTRYVASGKALTREQFEAPDTIARVAQRLRDIHALDSVAGSFDAWTDIRSWMSIADAKGLQRPGRLNALLDRVFEIQRSLASERMVEPVLCHNDPYHRNFLDDGTLWVIDWEFAGMGDPLYDLAAVAYSFESEQRDLLLASYYGDVDPLIRHQLDDLIVVYLCWCVVWSVLQIDDGIIDCDFAKLAESYLDMVEQ
ncbi:MAG: phosphotransferase [Actinobacteria bacterium]|nr:phosphotransferase [Actinomycetota bacterium]